MTESPNVAAFIRARQEQVLDRAIVALTAAEDDDLAAEAHRLAGTLGTFDLADAAAIARTLETAVREPDVTAAGVGAARATALDALASLSAARKEDRS